MPIHAATKARSTAGSRSRRGTRTDELDKSSHTVHETVRGDTNDDDNNDNNNNSNNNDLRNTATSSNQTPPITLSVPSHPKFTINPPPVGRAIRIYCDGIYDMFHFGHAKALEQAKKAFPNVYLLVGVCNDELTHSKKGKTVLTDKERYESLRHCKWVDEVVEDAPWVVDTAFLEKHQIDYVAHDDLPYQSEDQEDVYAHVKNLGKFLPTRRTEGVSTSDLITRIVRDYDAYLRRNLQRGISAKDLNISFLKEQELNVKRSVRELRDSIRRNWRGTREELMNELDDLKNGMRHMLRVWDDRSTEFIRGFTGLFGTDGMMKILRLGYSPTPSQASSDEEADSGSDDGRMGSAPPATTAADNNRSDSHPPRKRSASVACLDVRDGKKIIDSQ